MRTNNKSLVSRFTKSISNVVVAAALILSSGLAQAVLIDFDDVAFEYDYGCFCDHPLSDEWSSQGLLVNGLLSGYTDAEGNNHNTILGSPTLYLTFVGELPVFASIYVSAYYDQSIALTAYGPDGFIEQKWTNGWRGTEETSTPYEDNQFVFFDIPTGISSISIEAFFGLRVGAFADNLTYEYAAVPEPSALLLFALGLFGLAAAARRRQRAATNSQEKQPAQ